MNISVITYNHFSSAQLHIDTELADLILSPQMLSGLLLLPAEPPPDEDPPPIRDDEPPFPPPPKLLDPAPEEFARDLIDVGQ